MTPTEMIEVIKAYEEGNEIEIKDRNKNDWELIKVPLWNFAEFDYRVKPKETVIYQYLIYNSRLNNYQATFRFYQNSFDLQSALTSDWKIIQRLNHTKITIKEE